MKHQSLLTFLKIHKLINSLLKNLALLLSVQVQVHFRHYLNRRNRSQISHRPPCSPYRQIHSVFREIIKIHLLNKVLDGLSRMQHLHLLLALISLVVSVNLWVMPFKVWILGKIISFRINYKIQTSIHSYKIPQATKDLVIHLAFHKVLPIFK